MMSKNFLLQGKKEGGKEETAAAEAQRGGEKNCRRKENQSLSEEKNGRGAMGKNTSKKISREIKPIIGTRSRTKGGISWRAERDEEGRCLKKSTSGARGW